MRSFYNTGWTKCGQTKEKQKQLLEEATEYKFRNKGSMRKWILITRREKRKTEKERTKMNKDSQRKRKGRKSSRSIRIKPEQKNGVSY